MRYKPIHKKKHIIQALKQIAKQLEPQTYQVLDKFYKPFYQDAEGNFYDTPAQGDEPKRRMVTAMITEHPVNHGRRLKKAFKEFGEAGAWGYIYAFQKKPEVKAEENAPVKSLEAIPDPQIEGEGEE